MLIILINYLSSLGVKVPAVFSYLSTRMILAALTSLLLTIFLGPFFIKKLYALKIGQSIRSVEDCPLLAQLHSKKKNTPTMGGVLILLSMIVSLVLWMDLTSTFTILLLITTVFLGGIGILDDFLKLKYKSSQGLRGRYKLMMQVVFAAMVSFYLLYPASANFLSSKEGQPFIAKEQISSKEGGKFQTLTTREYISRLYVPFFKKPLFVFKGGSVILLLLFMMLVIIGSSNAVNLTDGLDGLATGCVVMVAAVLALFAFLSNNIEISHYLNILYIEKSGEIAIYLFAMVGGTLGFLWYNGYPAQIFMGDVGSLALGGIIGVSAVLLRREVLLAIIGGIFVMEAFSVILQVLSYRFRNKRRIFLCAPLHHHFEYRGWAEVKVVLRFWIIALLLAIIGIASLKFQ